MDLPRNSNALLSCHDLQWFSGLKMLKKYFIKPNGRWWDSLNTWYIKRKKYTEKAFETEGI